MARWTRRMLRRSVTVACCVVGAIALVAVADPAGHPMHPAGGSTPTSLRVLQLNLCDSGIASCYTGRSVAEAAAMIRAEGADIVTLNEVCRNDVSVLYRTLSDAHRGGVVLSAFKAAVDRRTGDAFRCRNGQQYGIGLLARIQAPHRGSTTYGGVYPTQDTADPEERVWLCVHAIAHFDACTTHLASTSRAVALNQCRYLLDTAIPAVRTHTANDAVILGADLNLTAAGPPSVQSCLPPGYVRTDDGALQHIMASNSFAVTRSRSISMHGSTDHPALLAELSIRRRAHS